MNAYIFRDKWTIRFIKTYRFSGNPLNIFFFFLALGHSYQFCLASNLELGVWCFFPLIYYRNENTIEIEMKILCKAQHFWQNGCSGQFSKIHNK